MSKEEKNGKSSKKMGKALMLVLAMLVCFNIGVMAQEIEATMAPENVKEAETTKIKKYFSCENGTVGVLLS